MADDTLELLDQLGLEKIRLFGWSDGGIVALAIAMKQPERVTALALYAADFHYNSVADGFYEKYEHMSPDDESLATARTAYQAQSPHPEQWPVFYRKSFAMWSTQPTYTVEQLGTIQAPTLVMTGDQDIVLPEHTKAMAQAIPNATMVILPNSTHWAPYSNPEPVNAAVLSFFSNQHPELARR
jgi:pimeloyl-ACP methyl ester carboxylesterase